jgi:OmpA-OmpF porin, OOP family
MKAKRFTWRRTLAVVAAAAVAMLWPSVLVAQTPGSGIPPVGGPGGGVGANPDGSGAGVPEASIWLVPNGKRTWFGVDLGQARYSTGCGFGGYRCKNPDLAGRVHVGGLLNGYVGLELGYLHLGDADRAGGTTSAQGVNFSVLGRVPAGDFTAFLKAGATFSRTEVSADPLSGVTTGTAKGWGSSLGVGLSWEVARHSALVVEWERHDLRFPGAGRNEVQLTTLGYRYKF